MHIRTVRFRHCKSLIFLAADFLFFFPMRVFPRGKSFAHVVVLDERKGR